ncbi:hypothetical protein BH18VER1_BH18VER1_22640 [soil metagenome]
MRAYNRLTVFLLIGVLLSLVWSGIAPKDRMTWWLEVAPAIAGLITIFLIRARFRFTPLLQTLIALHMLLLIVGGHYTYAEVPLGHWLADIFHLGRNHYDRFGHFAQGFVPALIAREVIVTWYGRPPSVKRSWRKILFRGERADANRRDLLTMPGSLFKRYQVPVFVVKRSFRIDIDFIGEWALPTVGFRPEPVRPNSNSVQRDIFGATDHPSNTNRINLKIIVYLLPQCGLLRKQIANIRDREAAPRSRQHRRRETVKAGNKDEECAIHGGIHWPAFTGRGNQCSNRQLVEKE